MPRQERTKSGTGIYHVMLRGINRQDIFEDAEDYLQMVACLRGLAIQSLEKSRRNYILKSAKEFGAGIRQLSRLTGVSYGVIQKL
jgi:hypothetical protein